MRSCFLPNFAHLYTTRSFDALLRFGTIAVRVHPCTLPRSLCTPAPTSRLKCVHSQSVAHPFLPPPPQAWASMPKPAAAPAPHGFGAIRHQPLRGGAGTKTAGSPWRLPVLAAFGGREDSNTTGEECFAGGQRSNTPNASAPAIGGSLPPPNPR